MGGTAKKRTLDSETEKKPFVPLSNKDVYREIMGHISGDADKLSAALTCRDISNIALDLLWRELRSIIHLLRVLPSFDIADDVYVLVDTLSNESQEFKRFVRYAARVRELVYNPDAERRIGESVFLACTQALAGQPLLRNLHFLRWTVPHSRMTVSEVQTFVHPGLPRLEIRIVGKRASHENLAGQGIQKFFCWLRGSGHTLQDISLSVGERMTLDRQEIQNILFMGHLKCLFLGIGRQDTIDLSSSLKVVQNFRRNQGAISSGIDFRSLRSLRVLGLDLSPGMAIGPAGTLDSLQELILKGPAKLITEFLGTILVPQLASVRLFVADSPRSERLLKIFSFLGHHALKIIAVCALSGLAELEALRLQFYQVSISMDDHDMARLAQTWQSLKILDLRHCETSTSRLPSMKSLVQVAENAPKLREVYLDIQNNIDSLLPLECAVFNHQLRILDLYFHWKDPKSEIGSMANFFHSLFPCLDTRGLVGDDQRWTEMLRLIDEKRGSRQLEK